MAKMAISNSIMYVPTHVCIYCLYICRGECVIKIEVSERQRLEEGGEEYKMVEMRI